MRFLSTLSLAAALLAGCASPEWTVLDDALGGVLLSANGDTLDDVWTVGGGLGTPGDALALRRSGDGWENMPTGFTDTLWWVWVSSPTDVFMVGENGRIARWDGSSITTMESGTTSVLYGVWGTSPTDVWAVGGDPFGMGDTDVILHYDGSTWTPATVPMPEGVAFFKVWGTASDDVWVVGQRGQILHWDGAAWSHVASPTTAPLFTVHGNTSGEIWIVGGPPAVILRWDGSAFADVELPAPASLLNGVAVAPNGEVLIVGARGTKLWYGADGVWIDDFDAPPAGDLHGAWIGGDHALAVGGNFNSPSGTARMGILAYRGTAPPAAP